MSTITYQRLYFAGIVLAASSVVHCSYDDQCGDWCEYGSAGTGGDAGSSGASGSSGSGGKGGTSGGTDSGSGGTAGAQGGEPNGGSAGTSSLPCDGACGSSKPFCKESSDTCVECLKDGDCDDATPFCDTATNTCVSCLDNEDCDSATASRCDGGQCVGCSEKADCSHISGKTACDTSASECVECTATDEDACGTKSCNPATHECTGTERGSVGKCMPCLADSECAGGSQVDPDYRCIPMEFQSSFRPGGFCLRRAAKSCGRPYLTPIARQSLSGAAAENYCGIDEDNVTCEAVLDLETSKVCPQGADGECGCSRDQDGTCTGPGSGGLCRDFTLVNDQCTYKCGVHNDCPDGKQCLGDPIKFCQTPIP